MTSDILDEWRVWRVACSAHRVTVVRAPRQQSAKLLAQLRSWEVIGHSMLIVGRGFWMREIEGVPVTTEGKCPCCLSGVPP